MANDEWGRPVETGGEFIQPRALQNHLVIVYPLGYIPLVQTKFTNIGSGKKSDAISVDLIDLDDKDEATGRPGRVYRNSNWMQSQLIVALRPMIGSKVLGVIGQGVSKSGLNAPWIIIDQLDNPQAMERASAWLAANPDFRPSTFVQRDAPQVQQYAQPPIQQQPQPAPNPGYQQQPMSQGYQQGPPPGYQPPPQQQQRPPSYPVAGSKQVSPEEMTILQQLRLKQQQERDAQQRHYGDEAPF